jgi:hypothetical protein
MGRKSLGSAVAPIQAIPCGGSYAVAFSLLTIISSRNRRAALIFLIVLLSKTDLPAVMIILSGAGGLKY